MAVDYRTALLDQLDPTQARRTSTSPLGDPTAPESPATAPKIGLAPDPAALYAAKMATTPLRPGFDPNASSMGALGNAGAQAATLAPQSHWNTPPPRGTLTPVPGVTGPLSSDPNSPNVLAANTYAATQQPPAPTTAPATASNTIYHPDKNGIFGFETSKLADPNKSDAKYTPAAKTFSQALGSGLQVTRGNMDAVANNPVIKAAFPNAKAVGDDKVDFGDGNGPIDLLGADAKGDLITFQNGGGGGGGSTDQTSSAPAAPASASGGMPGLATALQGDPYAAINAGLNSISGPSQTDTLLQTLLAQLRGGK